MNINVNRDLLIRTLKENRAQHVEEYEEAWKGYKVDVLKALEKVAKKAEKAKLGEDINTYPKEHLPVPTNHERDYTSIIDLLEFTEDSSIELSHSDFKRYVKDEWDWKNEHTANFASYYKGG